MLTSVSHSFSTGIMRLLKSFVKKNLERKNEPVLANFGIEYFYWKISRELMKAKHAQKALLWHQRK